MLNHIWLALIILGLLTAAGRDIYDGARNTYRNDVPITLTSPAQVKPEAGATLRGIWMLKGEDYLRHFGLESIPDLPDRMEFTATLHVRDDSSGRVILDLSDDAPQLLRTIANAQGGGKTLVGTAHLVRADSAGTRLAVILDPVGMVFLREVTNAAFDAAALAVRIAIGLIGIMALWLGVMKIAEEAGLIRLVVKIVRPVTVRLFPDVPPDHEAIGSIVMNVSANMLGLGNAATPFGLKAMEQLNQLNRHAGQATNAMVTFLAMNTSCITLIPATAIAVRAAMGSSNPAVIVGPTLLASLTATVCGVLIAKLLQRVPLFAPRKEET